MRIGTGCSSRLGVKDALQDAYQGLCTKLGQKPHLVICACSAEYEIPELLAVFREIAPGIPLHGVTSCLGIMCDSGFHSPQGLGLWGIHDPEGAFGVGMAEIGTDPALAGAAAIRSAIESAGRPGEPPYLVWLGGAPGHEEAVLRGIESEIGSHVPIAGGSSADNAVEGRWRQFTADGCHNNAVVVGALYPSGGIRYAFHNGYSPTESSGCASRAAGRVVYEIDGRPAAQVYDEWTGGAIHDLLDGGNILARTSLFPLGRVVGRYGGVPYYRLAHPDSVLENRALSLFADVSEGDQLVLMQGNPAGLIARAGSVARAALDQRDPLAPEVPVGALVVYCAGCMLTVRDRMDEVVDGLRLELGALPFLGSFTFGEQGCFVGGENRHGNLMILVVVFDAVRSGDADA